MSDLLEGIATGLISGVQGGSGAAYDILKSQREDEQKVGLESRLETMRSEIQVERAKRLEEAKNAMRGEQGRKIATEQEGLLSAKVQQQADAVSGTPGASEFVKSEMGASERDTEGAYLQAARKVGAPEQEKESADRLRDIERGLISGRQFDATESNRQRQHEENLTEIKAAEGRAVSRETTAELNNKRAIAIAAMNAAQKDVASIKSEMKVETDNARPIPQELTDKLREAEKEAKAQYGELKKLGGFAAEEKPVGKQAEQRDADLIYDPKTKKFSAYNATSAASGPTTKPAAGEKEKQMSIDEIDAEIKKSLTPSGEPVAHLADRVKELQRMRMAITNAEREKYRVK